MIINYELDDTHVIKALEICSAWPFETEEEFIAAVNDQARLLSRRSLDLCPNDPCTET